MKPACFLAAIFAALFSVSSSSAISIETVPVGNQGNPANLNSVNVDHPSGVGAVGHFFNIGKTEVTNAQYAAFLNAVAKSDPYELYHPSMHDVYGGIVQSGSWGSYTYSIKPPDNGAYLYDDKPVIFVNSGDAMRFANWLHNNQPSGPQNASMTEDGAYTLNGAMSDAALAAVTRNAGARWWLPSEDEWYKAAYHKNDGVTANYWNYPTSSNADPNNNPPSSDTGNSANFYVDNCASGWCGEPLTNAGAYMLSDSPYGTFDQGGNVWEWTETVFNGSYRFIRGGSWNNLSNNLHQGGYGYNIPTAEYNGIGFRVASAAVPEPGCVTLIFVATSALLFRRP